MKRLVGLVIAVCCGMGGPALSGVQSAYGCSDLSGRNGLPTVEGRDGVFYRVDPDMRNFHAFSDETVNLVGELSDALATGGTSLIYLPVPTKSLAMPAYLTGESEDFGFDPDLATTVYLDIVQRLENRGVATADARRAMVQAQTDAPAYFQTDHRWTPSGARIAAGAVAARLARAAGGAQAATSGPDPASGDAVTLDSAMFARIQQHCELALPPVTAIGPATAPHADTILDDTAPAASIVVVGTEYTGEPVVDFTGILSARTGRAVGRYSVTGGGAFAAISAYLTSDRFRSARPDVLVWEVPVERNLAQFGDQPMRELIAAAGDTCRVTLYPSPTARPNRIGIDLGALDTALDYTLLIDTDGAASPEATFIFRSRDGATRSRVIVRHSDQRLTDRFAMPTSGLWDGDLASVEVELDVPFGDTPTVKACFYTGKG